MAEMTISEVIRTAGERSPRDSVATIKNAVSRQIQQVDPAVDISHTEYFNHTYAPDLVLRWPADRYERHVFLRTSNSAQYLREDVVFLREEHPILMSLADLPAGRANAADGGLSQESASARTLVSNVEGLSAVAAQSVSETAPSVLGQAVLQGGRGLLDAQRASALTETFAAGLTGARSADPVSTGAAVEILEDNLDPPRAVGVTNVLQAFWVAGGGDGASFPGPAQLSVALNRGTLLFILTFMDVDDDEFWKRVAKGVTAESLVAVGNLASSPNLRRLISRCVHRLRFRVCQVRSGQLVGKQDDPMQWSLRDSSLVLEFGAVSAFFAVGARSDMGVPTVETDGISVKELTDRARRSGVPLSDVELAVGGRHIAYGSDGQDDVAGDATLPGIADVLGPRAQVRAATVPIDAERSLRCDFVARYAAGRTVAKYQLDELLALALPLLENLPPSRWNELSELLRAD